MTALNDDWLSWPPELIDGFYMLTENDTSKVIYLPEQQEASNVITES